MRRLSILISVIILTFVGIADGSSIISPAGGGATAWTGLTDTPGSITANQYVKGNSGGTALEFGAAPGTGTMTTVEIADTTLDASIVTIDFDGTYFVGVENPEDEANITLDLTPSSGNATLIGEEDAVQVKYDSTDFGEGTTGLALGTSPTIATSVLIGSDPADQGAVRLDNATVIAWEDATECTLTHVDNVGLSLNLAFSCGAITTSGDQVWDDNVTHSPLLTLRDADEESLTIQKNDGGAAGLTNSEGDLYFTMDGDSDDYIIMSTATNVPEIDTVGSTSLNISADGGDINLRPDGDDDDYFIFTTETNVPTLNVGGGSALTITPTTTITSDLVVSGGDITLGATSIFSGGDTASLNNIDAIDATTETTLEAAIDALANLVTVGTIGTGTWQGTAIADAYVPDNITIDLATLATTLTITDNENTAETNAVIFTAGGDLDGGDLGLESDGTFNYNPSTGTVEATAFTEGGNAMYNATDTPGGELGGTFASFTIDDSVAVSSWTLTTPTITSGATFTDANISPDAAGELVYDNTVTGLLDGAFAWYDDDAVRYLVDLATLPVDDDYVVAYDAAADGFYMKADADTGGAPVWEDVTHPTGDQTLTHSANEETTFEYTDTAYDAPMFLIHQHTGAVAAAEILLEVRAADSDVTVLEVGDGTNVWTVDTTGKLTNAGTAVIDVAAATDILVAGGQIDHDDLATDIATQAELDAVAALVDTADELEAILTNDNMDFGTGVVTATGFTIGSAAILEAELEILDGSTVTTTELEQLAAIGATTISAAQWAGLGGATTAGIALWDDADAPAQLVTLGLSATASEINTPLDGASVTLTEFQELEAIGATTISANQWALVGGLAETLTSAEVNILDGVTGVTAAELSYIGDVTSAIQAQIDALGGDITAVGPGFASGAAFTDGVVSTGTSFFVWEGTTDDAVEFIIVGPEDPTTSDSTVTFREASGTVLISGDTLTGHATATFDTDGSTATTVVDFALNADADAGDVDVKSIDGLYGVDDDIYVDMGTQGKLILAADTTVEILASDEDITFADGGANLINVGTNSGTATVDFGTINLATDALDLSEGDISNVGVIKADELEPDAVANGSLVVQSGQTATNTLKLQGYDVDGTAYTDTITITSANAVTMAIDTSDWDIDATGAITGVSLDADGTGNAITNIENADIKASAAIDATKIADGSISSTEFQYLDGLAADLATSLATGTVTISALLDVNEEVDIDFDNADEELAINNSAQYGADGAQVIIENTDADVTAAMYLLRLRYTDDGQANADFMVMEDNNGDDQITFTDGGSITAAGTVTGGTLTDGTASINSGAVTGVTTLAAATSVSSDLFDVTGAEDLDIGSADVLDVTIVTDGGTVIIDGSITAAGEDLGSSTAEWGDFYIADDKDVKLGSDQDWDVLYDETTDDRLEFVHTAGAGADVYFDLNDNAADSTYTITNSDATYEANLDVEGDATFGGTITSTASGDSYLQLTSNASLAPANNRLYVEANEWKMSENGAEETILSDTDSATLTGASWNFGSVTNFKIATGNTAAADAEGEMAVDTDDDQFQVYVGGVKIVFDFTADAADYVLKSDGAGTFTMQAEAAGSPAWHTIADPTSDAGIEHDAGEETSFTYTGNFSTGSQFLIEQLTGNPTGGTLFEVKAADANVTAAKIGDGTNMTQFSQTGDLTLAGTASITAGGIILGDSTPDAAGEFGFDGTNSFSLYGANSEDLEINVGTAANTCTVTSNTAVDNLDVQIATLTADAIVASGAISGNNVNPDAADGATLGTAALEWSDLYLAASGVIYGENDQANTLTSAATGWIMNLDLTVTGDQIMMGADPADAGNIRMGNATVIAFEDATECTLTHVDNTGLAVNLNMEAATITEGGVAVHNNDEMDASSELAAIIDDETGSGLIMFNNAPALAGETTIGDPGGILLTDDNYIELDATADGMDDDEHNGVVIGGRNCGENLTQWDTVYLKGDDADIWHQADATAASGEYPAMGICVAAASDGAEARILIRGIVRNEGWTGLTVGGAVYLGETDGALTQTAPSTSNDCVQIIGFALSDSEILFDFSRPYQLVE